MQHHELIDGHYRLVRRMGHHWLVQDEQTHLPGLMMPLDDFADIRVVRWLEKIWHPGLPRVLDQVSDGEHPSLVVLDYLPGQCLSDFLSTRRRCRPTRLLPIIRQAARLLQFLHEASDPPLMHLDLKPEHWIMLPSGELGLIDFQTALFHEPDSGPTGREKQRLTLVYAAPERMAGHPCPASDLFALALMCLQYLTRRPPEYCRNHAPNDLLPAQQAALADLLSRCLADDPANRPATISVFIAALDAVIESQARGYPLRERCSEWMKQAGQSVRAFIPVHPDTSGRPERSDTPSSSSATRICVWQEAELACELASVWSRRTDVLLIDFDLGDPRCAAYLQPLPSRHQPNCIEAGSVLQRQTAEETSVLLQILREADDQCDICLTVTSGMPQDAAACIGLLTADLIIMPIKGDLIHWQSCRRQVQHLASVGLVSDQRIYYVLFPYQAQRELCTDSIRRLTHDQLAGTISDCPERDRHRGSHRPYWTRMIRRNRQEYGRLIDYLEQQLQRGRSERHASG